MKNSTLRYWIEHLPELKRRYVATRRTWRRAYRLARRAEEAMLHATDVLHIAESNEVYRGVCLKSASHGSKKGVYWEGQVDGDDVGIKRRARWWRNCNDRSEFRVELADKACGRDNYGREVTVARWYHARSKDEVVAAAKDWVALAAIPPEWKTQA